MRPGAPGPCFCCGAPLGPTERKCDLCSTTRWSLDEDVAARSLRVRITRPGTPVPTRAHASDSGVDLSLQAWRWTDADGDAVSTEPLYLPPGRVAQVFLGVAVALPPGTEGVIRPRSSISRRGLWCPVGTIDNGYVGELSCYLGNVTGYPARPIRPDDRVCQLVVSPVALPGIAVVDELGETERGAAGHGSSGR